MTTPRQREVWAVEHIDGTRVMFGTHEEAVRWATTGQPQQVVRYVPASALEAARREAYEEIEALLDAVRRRADPEDQIDWLHDELRIRAAKAAKGEGET